MITFEITFIEKGPRNGNFKKCVFKIFIGTILLILWIFCNAFVHIKFYLLQYKFINVAIINKLAVEADYVCIRRDSLDF